MRLEKFDATTSKWVPIGVDDAVGTIQAIGATWIRNLRVTINGRETFNSNSLYAYKSYIDLELSYNREVKSTFLGVMGYFPMGAQQFNQNVANEQYTSSKQVFEKGRVAQFYTKLNADIFSSELLMINNVAIEIEIHPNDAKFMLMDLDTAATATTKPSYRLSLTSCKLFCKYVQLMEGLAMDIDRHLQQSPARYGIRRSELKSHYISADRLEFQSSLFTEQLPRRIIIGLVDADAYAGSLSKSPFNFMHNSVREISITCGTESTPSVLYNLDFDSHHFMRAYVDMMEGVGFASSLETNGISPKHFKNGWALFTFTLTADLENSAAFELIRSGTTSIHIRFAKKVKTGGLHLIAYGVSCLRARVEQAQMLLLIQISGDGLVAHARQTSPAHKRFDYVRSSAEGCVCVALLCPVLKNKLFTDERLCEERSNALNNIAL